MKKSHIALIGMGYLGTPLSEALLSQGFSVFSTTRANLDLTSLKTTDIIPVEILKADIIIYDVPPLEIKVIEPFFKNFSSDKKIIFTSSISIYGPNRGSVNEDFEVPDDSPFAPIVLKAEKFVTKHFKNLALLRLGGLYGNTKKSKRHPVHFLAGRTHLTNGNEFLHLVHVKDCVQAILEVIALDLFPSELNIISDQRVLKKDYYVKMSKILGLTPPEFEDIKIESPTLISNQKSKELLKLSYCNPFDYRIED